MIDTTIYNPRNDAHFARIKPVGRRVRVLRGGVELAHSPDALRVQETGSDVYDPVIYIPQADATSALRSVEGKSTRCPLKGQASYFDLDGEEIAWTYDRPLEGARMLAGHIAFYADKVIVEEIGADA